MTGQNLKFRVATVEHAPQLQQLVQGAFRAEDSRKDWTADMALGASFTISVDNITGRITNPDGGMLIAEKNNDIVACIGILKHDADLARLSLLTVDQRHQRGGLGRRVLAYAEGYCYLTWGIEKFGLNAVSSRQELISWYTRCGYHTIGEVTPFPFDRTSSAWLEKDLYLVELEKDWNPLSETTGTA